MDFFFSLSGVPSFFCPHGQLGGTNGVAWRNEGWAGLGFGVLPPLCPGGTARGGVVHDAFPRPFFHPPLTSGALNSPPYPSTRAPLR